MDRLLYTAIDKAWCVSANGEHLWTIQLPPKPGWEKVVERVETYGTSKEIADALTFMELGYPVTLQDIKQQYHALAKQWHPDLHAGDPLMSERMIKLNKAVEILTGADPDSILGERSTTVYHKMVFGRFEGMEVAMIGPGEDWIYAASFAEQGNDTYVGSYSGKIIQLNDEGSSLRVLDVGSPPRQILDNGGYLYILTDTRLYVVHGEFLLRIVDIFEKGEFIPAEAGFGLLARKTFKWFSKEGSLLGEVYTKDPIRQVYSTPKGLVIETRQHRATISGAPRWWS